MKRQRFALTLFLAFALVPGLGPDPLSAQEGPPPQGSRSGGLALGLSAGGGAVDNKRLTETWTFGPVFGGRIEWSMKESSALLKVDVQPFRADRTDRFGDFRAIYILPSYALGTPGRQVALSLGMGIFDLTEEGAEDDREVGFVAALYGSNRLTRTLSVELGWKRIRNVAGLKVSFYTLQLVQRWGF